MSATIDTQFEDVEITLDEGQEDKLPEGVEIEKVDRGCCRCLGFKGVNEAKGYALLGVVRATIIMSNIFLSTSLIYLANVEAGCTEIPEGEECTATVYGFRPSSLITNIAIISGIMAALLMPFCGAIIDYTPHRKLVGILSAVVITLIQAAQIATVQSTWFIMAILQAIGGFLYQVQVLATYSYLPEIGRVVGDETMTSFTATFVIIQFAAQATFLVLIIGISLALSFSDVLTAQVSQAVDTCIIIVLFTVAWSYLPKVPALHEKKGKCLLTAGFTQIWRTMKGINKHYSNGLRWFLVAQTFASAGANAFTTVSVTFMYEVLSMSGTETGIVFLIALVSALPGSKIGEFVSRRTNPVLSWKLLLLWFSAVTVAGAFILDGPDKKNICYIFGILWGMCLGWFYPTSALIFSLSLPKGQESELTGFFIYSTQIIVWLPPFIFTLMNEAGLNMKWGLISLDIFFIIAIGFLQLMAPWEEVRESTKTNKMIDTAIAYDE